MTRIYSNRSLCPPQKEDKRIEHRKSNNNFKKLLQNKLHKDQALKFSKHAKQRLRSRNINCTKQDINKLAQAVSKAEDKGVKESLVLINDNAYIISVKNKTVITAMDKDSMKENLFTNIDSAIVMK